MSMEELAEPVSHSELIALIDAMVTQALSSCPLEPEGNGEPYFLSTDGGRGGYRK